jgi:hypothetical protein
VPALSFVADFYVRWSVATVSETIEIVREARILAEDARRKAETHKGTRLEAGYRFWQRRFEAVAEGLTLWLIEQDRPPPDKVIPFRRKQRTPAVCSPVAPRVQNARLAVHSGSGLFRTFSCSPLKAIAKRFSLHFFK